MDGLGAGIANSWIEQYQQTQIPCITNAGAVATYTTEEEDCTFSKCILYAVIGFVVGNMIKKGKQ